jgi:putative SOS response-associated peptidase YedK
MNLTARQVGGRMAVLATGVSRARRQQDMQPYFIRRSHDDPMAFRGQSVLVEDSVAIHP